MEKVLLIFGAMVASVLFIFLVACLFAWPLMYLINSVFSTEFLHFVFGGEITFWQTFFLQFIFGLLFGTKSNSSSKNKG